METMEERGKLVCASDSDVLKMNCLEAVSSNIGKGRADSGLWDLSDPKILYIYKWPVLFHSFTLFQPFLGKKPLFRGVSKWCLKMSEKHSNHALVYNFQKKKIYSLTVKPHYRIIGGAPTGGLSNVHVSKVAKSAGLGIISVTMKIFAILGYWQWNRIAESLDHCRFSDPFDDKKSFVTNLSSLGIPSSCSYQTLF